MSYILRTENICKNFNDTIALKNINFNLKFGEIHGIVGANGSGKSTLMNILFGSKYIHDTGGYEGKIFVDEKEIKITNINDAIENNIGMVHQELSLLSNLDISSNIKLNREKTIEKTNFLKNYALVDKSANDDDAKLSLTKIGIKLNPQIEVRDISTNQKQFVEIAREINKENLKILILDEPTSSLSMEETKQLLNHLKNLSKKGLAIIFISHRLEEIQFICDRVTILRDGEIVCTKSTGNLTINEMALNMVGTDIVQTRKENRKLSNENILYFNNVMVTYGDRIYRDISLNVKKGEILGITGLAGHGQEIFGYGLMGLYNMKGDVIFNANKITPGYPEKMLQQNIYLLPDDRKEMGLMLDRSVWENMVFETYTKNIDFIKYPVLRKLSPLNYKNIFNYTTTMIENLDIKTSSLKQKVSELSGGNQQKVCIARAITVNPKLLFIGEPTRGIDIYSKEVILDFLLDLNKNMNTTIVVTSGEISELKRICDRIVIMYENNVFEIFEGHYDTEAFNLAISGRRPSYD